MTVRLWDWEKGWKCVQVFEGHSHYVMGMAINPKDTNTFATACLDRTVKIWNLGSPHANFTLEAHETKGVNHVDYYPGSDKPYLLTTSDDKTVKVSKSSGRILRPKAKRTDMNTFRSGITPPRPSLQPLKATPVMFLLLATTPSFPSSSPVPKMAQSRSGTPIPTAWSSHSVMVWSGHGVSPTSRAGKELLWVSTMVQWL